MDRTRICVGTVCVVVFVVGVHSLILLSDQPGIHRRLKRNTASQDDNATTVSDAQDQTSTIATTTQLNQTAGAIGAESTNVSSPVSSPNNTTQSPTAAAPAVSTPILSTEVPRQNATTTDPQDDLSTAEVTQPTVINVMSSINPSTPDASTAAAQAPVTSTSSPSQPPDVTAQASSPAAAAPTSPAATPAPPAPAPTTAETVTTSTTDAGIVVPPKTTEKSTSISTSTTESVIIYRPGDKEKKKSLNRLAIILPIVIFVVLALVLVAVLLCCRYGLFRRKQKSNKRTVRGGDGDLWAENGGIDNVAVLDDSDMRREKELDDVDGVSISAVMHGGKLYEVDYGFEAVEDAHLGLAPGNVVEVIEKLESGWWRGFVGDNEGWFPATYVHTLDKHGTPPTPSSGPETPSHAAVNQAFDAVEDVVKETPVEPRATNGETMETEPVRDSLHDKLIRAISQAEVSKKSQYVALGDYRAESSDELSLTRGDLLTHMNKDPGGWTRVKHNDTGENGWVPTSYLQQITSEDDVFLEDEEPSEELPGTGAGGSPGTRGEPPGAGAEEEFYDDDDELDVDWEADFDEDQDELTGIEHRAIHPYTAQQEGDLTFDADDTVIVFEMLSNGWWRGCANKQEGWFPGTYVEAVAQSPREGDGSSDVGLSLVPEPKRVTLQMDHNVEYPPPDLAYPVPEEQLRDSSLERRMQADLREKLRDPLYSAAGAASQPAGEKPVVPVRFVTPKLVRVSRNTLTRSAHKLKRPRRPAPPPPAGVEPYRTLTKHSIPKAKNKPLPPPRRTSTKLYSQPHTQSTQPPAPPQRTVVPKLIKLPTPSQGSPERRVTSSLRSPDNMTSSPRSPEHDGRSSKPCPTRPAPPAPQAVLEARAQSIQSLASSTGSLIPPPLSFMDSVQKLDLLGRETEEPKVKAQAPQPAKRTSVTGKADQISPSTIQDVSAGKISSVSTNSLDMYSSIDSKDSNSSWGRSTSSLEKRDRPVMAVKPVMKFVQGEAWKDEIRRASRPVSGDPRPTSGSGHVDDHVSSNTMRVLPQQQETRRKARPNPPPRKTVPPPGGSGGIPLHDRPGPGPAGTPRGPAAGRPGASTSSTDSAGGGSTISGGKPAPPRPPPPRPSGPPPPPHASVVMRQKNSPGKSNADKRKSTLRRAAHSYHSAEQGHLSFSQDSFIKELGEVPGRPGWMLGMLADGTTGIYPRDRVEDLAPGGVRVSRV